MKTLIFDAGPIISLTANNMLWILESLKQKFDGDFLLPIGVKRELIDKPLQTRRFKLEALLVQRLIDKKLFKVVRNKDVVSKARDLLKLANSILSAHGRSISILQTGEVEVIASALYFKSDTVVIDEHITRTLLESPEKLHRFMEKRMHVKLQLNKNALDKFVKLTKHLTVIRSIELITVAYEKGVLNEYIVNIPNARRELLESLLWGMCTEGASVSEEEINSIIRSEKL